MRLGKFTDVQLGGIDNTDYPRFTDAHIASAWHEKAGREATESEINKLENDYADTINETCCLRFWEE